MYLRRRIRIYVNRLFHEQLRWTMDRLAIDGRHCTRVLQDKPVCGRREDRYGQSRCVAIGWPCLTKEVRRSLQGMWCDPITPPPAQSPIRYQPNLRRRPLASPFRPFCPAENCGGSGPPGSGTPARRPQVSWITEPMQRLHMSESLALFDIAQLQKS